MIIARTNEAANGALPIPHGIPDGEGSRFACRTPTQPSRPVLPIRSAELWRAQRKGGSDLARGEITLHVASERTTGLCVALFGHHGVGKTTLLSYLLDRRTLLAPHGKSDDGASPLAPDPEEERHGLSLRLHVATVSTPSRTVFFLDCPGEPDFTAESISARAVADFAVVVVDANTDPGGVALDARQWAKQQGIPCMIVLTKLDRPDMQFDVVLDRLESAFGEPVMPLGVPLAERPEIQSVFDVITGNRHDAGAKGPVADPKLSQAYAGMRSRLEEAAADMDDSLLTQYLEGGIRVSDLAYGLSRCAAAGHLFLLPVCPTGGCGLDLFVDTCLSLVPSPRPIAAMAEDGSPLQLEASELRPSIRAFKTLADPYVGRLTLFRVISGTVGPDTHLTNCRSGQEERLGPLFHVIGRRQIPVSSLGPGDVGAVAKLQSTLTGDVLCALNWRVTLPALTFPTPTVRMAVRPAQPSAESKLVPCLNRLIEEDPSLHLEAQEQTGELLLAGLGEIHLEVAMERLARKFGVQAALVWPKVPYRETIRGKARAEGKHKKQTGGHGQYGHVFLEIEPCLDGEFQFEDRIFGGAVPQTYRPAVEKGVRDAMSQGVLAGYPVVGVKVTLVDGSYHPVDSSEMAFKLAGALAFQKACRNSQPVLLEPIVDLEIECPDATVGDVIADLQKKRGRVIGLSLENGIRKIRAQAPEAEMMRFSSDLRSLTAARGKFSARRSKYAQVPAHVAERVMAAATAKR